MCAIVAKKGIEVYQTCLVKQMVDLGEGHPDFLKTIWLIYSMRMDDLMKPSNVPIMFG